MKRGLWMVLFAGVTGCDSIMASEVEQELWNALEIRNYQFTYTVSCFCGFVGPNPALITVQNGAVTRVEYLPARVGKAAIRHRGIRQSTASLRSSTGSRQGIRPISMSISGAGSGGSASVVTVTVLL